MLKREIKRTKQNEFIKKKATTNITDGEQ